MVLVALFACTSEPATGTWSAPEMDCVLESPRAIDEDALPTWQSLYGPAYLDYVDYAHQLADAATRYGCPGRVVDGDVETYTGDCESEGFTFRGTAVLTDFGSDEGSWSADWESVYWAEEYADTVEIDGWLTADVTTMTIDESLTTSVLDDSHPARAGRWSYGRVTMFTEDGTEPTSESAWFTESEPADGPSGGYCYAYEKPVDGEVGGFAVWADRTLVVTLIDDSGCGPATFDDSQIGEVCI